MKQKINIFIVDDDNMLVDGLMLLFNEVRDIEYIGRANSPEEMLQKTAQFMKTIDIILMDVSFLNSPMNGIELAKIIRDKYPGVLPRIVFMTISNKALADAERGFHGLLPKNQGLAELINNLKDIYYNHKVFYPSNETD